MGCTVEFVEGEGPKLSTIRSGADVAHLSSSGLHQHLAPVYETLRRLRADLPNETALIGFAGARVIKQTVREKLPEGFQRSEFLLDHGAIDMIIDRQDLRERMANLLSILTGRPRP